MDSGSRPEWASRYAAELVRRGAAGSLKELVARGLQQWITAGQQRPEDAARVQHRAATDHSYRFRARWESTHNERSSTSEVHFETPPPPDHSNRVGGSVR
jgi:hypothetical protein